MLVQIDLKSTLSIHDQVIEGLKELIIAGILKPDDKLPSVREMAAQLTINPNTIQKAYRELERQSYIYSARGKGSFVMPRDHVADPNKVDATKNALIKDIKMAKFLGIPKSEIIQMVNKLYHSQEETHDSSN